MSNALALAATSAVLQGLLNNVLTGAGLGTVNVTAVAPDLVPITPSGSSPVLQVNLFLHQVTPNAAWRNVGLPSLAADGSTQLRSRPLALDLHYLLTAYGNNNFEAEALLGYAVQLLHETPVLARADIRALLDPSVGSPPAVGSVPLDLSTGLADQIELLKITPATLGREEVAWLWTALKADYRPTFPFQVTVVLISTAESGVSALPVLRRHVKAQPDLVYQSPLPTLIAVTPPLQQPAKPGEVVTVIGMNLLGTGPATILLNNSRLGVTQAVAAANVTNGSLQFTVPNLPPPAVPPKPPPAPPNNPAGVYLLAVQVTTAAGVLTSNSLPFAIAPVITVPPASPITRDAAGNATVKLTCAPYVYPGQEVSLLIGGQSAPAVAFTSPVNTLSFAFTALQAAPAAIPLRLRVDGVDSQIIDLTHPKRPVFSGPAVVVT